MNKKLRSNCVLIAFNCVPPIGLEFQIKDTKLYVSVITLSNENDIKLLEKLNLGFKKTIKWNKYRSQMTIQNNNSNLNYLIDPTLTNVNRLFVLSFKRIEENNVKKDYRDSFSHYYVPKVQIKDFNVLIDWKIFSICQLKMKKKLKKKSLVCAIIMITLPVIY